MGISLFGLTPAATYPSLIKFGDNSAISGVLRALSDGLGNDLPIQVSNTAVNFTGTVTGIPSTPPSGVAGAIQFSDGSAFASDATNFFWDNTNKRLGVGTNAPSATFHSVGEGRFKSLILGAASVTAISNTSQDVAINITNQGVGIGSFTTFSPTARLQVKGSGSTSATTSLLVQNSAGSTAMTVKDDLSGIFTGIIEFQNNVNLRGANFTQSNLNMRFVVPGATKTFLINADYGDTNAPSAILEVQSTTKGFLPPRMTTTQRDAIATPATGLRIYNTTTNTNDTYNGTVWQSNSVSGVAGAIQFSDGSAFASDASNLFWDDTNNRLGIGTNAPASQQEIKGNGNQLWITNSADIYTYLKFSAQSGFASMIFGDGNGTVNYFNNYATGVWASNKFAFGPSYFAPSGQVHIKGSGSTSATTSLLVQNSAGLAALTVRDDREVVCGAGLTVGSSIFADRAISQNGSSSFINNTSFNSQQSYPRFGLTTDASVFYYQGSFAPTTGSGAFAVFNATPTINQTGGANGITRGLYINPTLTAAADFRAIEVSNGGAYINTTSVQSSAILQADSTTKGFLPPRMTTTQKNAIASPASGLVVYDSTTNKLNYNNGTVWKEVTPDGYTGLVTVNATPPVTFDIQNGIIVNVI